ncbi:Asp-tRNA(Asn)/Glu-tRNA(Gln) amidotransferase subunit GatC [Chitinispirillales bacterium ANBcel5]|uniref:Asp-tRNA(Asn)/Glu-tRNA(Gln) amidotransferase subunit GatC n=1 Tax=Cellulosispirillum alkaliphilum TaxID=3039283 RepID=UPI002A58FE33|nr:Asp-tRNA(Asn)/Glu-tRNA(Gln) amidotransferase subunit GatC [Chitinispirillales bacterium ANBcel5]
MIDKEKVLYVAKLARLKLSDHEVENFTAQLGSIVRYIDQLDQIDTSQIEPTCFVEPTHDPLRDDVEIPSLSNESVLANGPKVKKGHFAIPKVIGG